MSPQWKTTLLPRLEGFDLFPYGAGKDGKRPIGGTGWKTKPETVADIAARNGSCPAIALYPSKASGLEAFDIDGKTADEYLRNTLGVDPDEAVKKGAWKIWRQSDPYRYKLIFRTDIEEGKKGKSKIETLSREESPDSQNSWNGSMAGKGCSLLACIKPVATITNGRMGPRKKALKTSPTHSENGKR
jgi:hypothetical protein